MPQPTPIGTRIRFLSTLTAPARGAHPPLLYARKGDTGIIAGHRPREGYLVKAPGYPAHFGVTLSEVEPETPITQLSSRTPHDH